MGPVLSIVGIVVSGISSASKPPAMQYQQQKQSNLMNFKPKQEEAETDITGFEHAETYDISGYKGQNESQRIDGEYGYDIAGYDSGEGEGEGESITGF